MIQEFLKRNLFELQYIYTYSKRVWEDKPEFYIQYVHVNCT